MAVQIFRHKCWFKSSMFETIAVVSGDGFPPSTLTMPKTHCGKEKKKTLKLCFNLVARQNVLTKQQKQNNPCILFIYLFRSTYFKLSIFLEQHISSSYSSFVHICACTKLNSMTHAYMLVNMKDKSVCGEQRLRH